MQSLFSLCAVSYLLIYAFEGAIRYGLYNIGHDDAILLRDGLVLLPLAALFTTQAFRLRVHPAFFVFAGVIGLHGLIAVLNLGTTVPAIYGTKLMVNVLFGFLAARPLAQPSRRVLWLLALVWLVSVTGVVLTSSSTRFRGWGSRPISAASRSMFRAAGTSTVGSTSAPRVSLAVRLRQRCCCRLWP